LSQLTVTVTIDNALVKMQPCILCHFVTFNKHTRCSFSIHTSQQVRVPKQWHAFVNISQIQCQISVTTNTYHITTVFCDTIAGKKQESKNSTNLRVHRRHQKSTYPDHQVLTVCEYEHLPCLHC